MPERRRPGRRVAGILAGAVIIAALVIGSVSRFRGAGRTDLVGDVGGVERNDPLSQVNEGLRNSDPAALAVVQERVQPRPDVPRQALSDAEAAQWILALSALRTGYLRYSPPARATAVAVACRILDKFAIEPAPAHWVNALPPLHDLLSAGLSDSDPVVRYTALVETSRLWIWVPGRSLMPVEEQALAEWKGTIYPGVVRCLACASSAQTRMAAVACLGALPLDDAAAPAIAYIDDPDPSVRKQTLASFAQRNLLLTEDMLLRRLHDEDEFIRETASVVLKTRGFTPEQIRLGTSMFSPRPDERIKVASLVKNRTDLDPVVWLLQLTRDDVANVRQSAVEALAAHKTPAVERRLSEIARSDNSPAVRQAASKLVPPTDETTASLPPLPGTSSLSPKAN
jgi:HEAT repeat protein